MYFSSKEPPRLYPADKDPLMDCGAQPVLSVARALFAGMLVWMKDV
jgi:hypothetical protein